MNQQKDKKTLKQMTKAKFRRQNTCANCAYKNPIEDDKVIECTAFPSAPFVHQAYICNKYKKQK